MTDMPKWMLRWQTQRTEGRAKYIFKAGVLGYGLAMFVAMTFFVAPPAVLNARAIAINALTWAVAGAVFVALTWWISEWRYARHARKTTGHSDSGDAV
jgi:hypothetical protein